MYFVIDLSYVLLAELSALVQMHIINQDNQISYDNDYHYHKEKVKNIKPLNSIKLITSC